ncbi:signal peptidase I [Candidatus Woesearchaeota archaeon]|nr:signal peptidase I [Candidatus Woesearchaeota archaeon]MBW3021636.1 signal peptidase I [Candidatus Woesearchaeota archaeon]
MFKKQQKEKPQTTLGKIWYFIWEEDSVWSWVVNIILAFVIIKFLVYPGLGLALGTQHPIVAVVSGSMEHDGSFDEWWASPAMCDNLRCSQEDWYSNAGISKDEFREFHFRNGFNIGDIIVLRGKEPKDLNVGDVLVFDINKPVPIIHRTVDIWQENEDYYFATKGDHNADTIDQITEDRINEKQIIGKAWFRIPWLGYVKIWFVKGLQLVGLVR